MNATSAGPATARGSLLLHLACVLALMWPPLINGQPFFFPDTTSYVRAADKAVAIVTGGRVTTVWSAERPTPADRSATARPTGSPATVGRPPARGNAPDSGVIMAGRSPYFGMLLWLAWVASSFWLFVIAQAAIGYALVRLTLRQFGLRSARAIGIAVATLGLASTLPFYTGMLLADALAGFGILAFMLLVTGWRDVSVGERVFLIAILLASCASHLIHIVMLGGMIGVVLAWLAVRAIRWPQVRPAVIAGVAVLLVGSASVAVTSFAIKAAFGRPPMLVPLLTARFIADGPGHDFIRSGCGGRDFAVCRIADRPWTSASKFLWSTDPAIGGYLVEDQAVREQMAAEDGAFGRAVLAAYPVAQGQAIVANSVEQFFRFGLRILNVGCGPGRPCGISLPPGVLAVMQKTPAGLDLWPQTPLTVIVYVAAAVGAAILLWASASAGALAPEDRRRLLFWLAMMLVAFAINAVLGGAVSEPQSRYQARLIWIVPLLGTVAAMLMRRRSPR